MHLQSTHAFGIFQLYSVSMDNRHSILDVWEQFPPVTEILVLTEMDGNIIIVAITDGMP